MEKENSAQKKDLDPTRPWVPAAVTAIPEYLKDERFSYYFATVGTKSYNRKISEGYEVDKELSKSLNLSPTLNDRTQVPGSPTYLRGEILLRIPKDRKIARDKYYAGLAANKRKGIYSSLEGASDTTGIPIIDGGNKNPV